MPRAALLLPAIVLLASACSAGAWSSAAIKGSGKTATQQVPVQGTFTALKVEGALHVVVIRGDAVAVSASADDNLLPLLRSEVENGTLRLWTDGSYSTTTPFVVTVTAPAVTGLSLHGATEAKVDVLGGKDDAWIVLNDAAKAEVADATCASLVVRATGATQATVAKAGGKKLEVKSSNSSKVLVSGGFDEAKVLVEGASHVGDASLKAKRANVVVAGASHADLDVSEFLKADATGASSIRYGGEPKVEGTVGKVAEVKPR